MNDDVKGDLMQRSREWLQSCVNAATRSGVPEEADLEAFILAHLDGEDARTAAAVAAAREEMREACAQNFPKTREESLSDPWASALVRATSLTATPLADRIAVMGLQMTELEGLLKRAEAERDAARADAKARVEDWNNERTTVVMERRRANDLEAERDALAGVRKSFADEVAALQAEIHALRAQVEAARVLCREVCDLRDSDYVNAYEVLAAMDGAKPK